MRNGTTSLSRPTVQPLAGQLTFPSEQAFAPSPRQQYGLPSPIPHDKQGVTAQQPFAKINKRLAPGPVAKIVIALQQARF